jgi:hypothetical protein
VTSHCSLAGRERECVSQPSVPGTVLPMMPKTLLLNVALRDGHLEGLDIGLSERKRSRDVAHGGSYGEGLAFD